MQNKIVEAVLFLKKDMTNNLSAMCRTGISIATIGSSIWTGIILRIGIRTMVAVAR